MARKAAADKYLELEKNYILPDMASLKKAWDAFVALKGEEIRQREYVTTIRYYDSEAFDLLASGATLRKMDACPPLFRAEIDVKTIGKALEGGTMDRKEFPFPMDKDVFDLSVVTEPEAIALLKPLEGKDIREVFYNVNDRQDLRKTFGKAAAKGTIEVSIERADFVDTKTKKIFYSMFQLEIEFKQKYSSRSMNIRQAEGLIDHIGSTITQGIDNITVNTRSKAEIGFTPYLPKT